jgi:stage II sporulation protein D
MVLNGHGFGHGVGLCQEGAMKMARNSYSFDQIIGFYFPDFTISKIIYK